MKKKKQSLDTWMDMPDDMKRYLQNYGLHFNHKMYKYAVSQMWKENKDGKKEKIEPVEKEKVYEILKKHNITLENDVMYDATYVYSMVMADFMGKSIPTEQYVAMYIKDVIDDVDKPDGFVFNRWYSDECLSGTPIDWEEYI
jgi:hypothetical protein